MKKDKKIPAAILWTIIVLLVAILILLLVYIQKNKRQASSLRGKQTSADTEWDASEDDTAFDGTEYFEIDMSDSEIDWDEWDAWADDGEDMNGDVTINDTSYTMDHAIKTYLFIGTDGSGNDSGKGTDYQGAMADVLMLIAFDEQKQQMGILQLNRDTITDVPMLQNDGTAYASADMQICTAHYYGKDRKASCENTVEAVSSMLGGLTIDGYYALPMEAIPKINELVGGVTITFSEDMTDIDPAMKEGATLTLTDAQAELLIRSRYNLEDDRNSERMNRQQTFLNAFFAQVGAMCQSDKQAAIKIYNGLHPYATESMNYKEFTNLLSKSQSYTNTGIRTIAGESKIGTTLSDGLEHWEFYMDDASLQSTLQEMFDLTEVDENEGEDLEDE